MRRPWPVYVLGVALVIMLAYIKERTKVRRVEKFALFGPNKIPYSQLVTAMYTPKELKEWQAATWDPLTLEQKNEKIGAWDALSAKEQNKQYNEYLMQKNARLSIENTGIPAA